VVSDRSRASTSGRRQRRRGSRASTIVWVGILAVAVLTVIAAFVMPLPKANPGDQGSGGGSVTAAASPGTTATPTPTPTPQPSTSSASPKPSPSPSPAATQTTAVSIAAGGDVMGAWGIDSAIGGYGADYVMKDIKKVLKPADVAFFNAEGPYSDTGTAATWKDVYFRGNPRLVPAMAKAGVDVVTMANNHCLDYGSAALLDSIRRFNANDIQVVGAGKNIAAAWKMRFVERKGVKIGFMGWTDVMPPGFAATRTGAGAAVGPMWSGASTVTKAIRAAAGKVDILVASYHWGVEGQHYPIGQQIQEAHAAIDAGADLVMSHHPHWLQGIERYHGGLIMYSFGDLAFPPLSRDAAETVIMTNVVSDRWIKTTITPYLLGSNGVPRRATGSDASGILAKLNSYSKARGTSITIDKATQSATVKVKRRP
jgi:poly-gamma-glutamate capsule biosynthesis protein CapA/YwtB (metallophosphatase superfamily)